MNKPAPLRVKVPYWAKDIEDQGILCLVAFMYKISEKYGYDTYTITKKDVNMMVGTRVGKTLKELHDRAPILKFWLNLQWTTLHFLQVNLKVYRRNWNEENKSSEWVTIEDERTIRVWCYILGAWRHHLITDDPFKSSIKAAMHNNDQKLFQYCDYDATGRKG
jgi:hypothetical protein